MYHKHKITIILFLLSCFIVVFFCNLYQFDNKYNTPPPYGQYGILTVSEEDFYRKTPIYLTDGWLLTDKNTTNQETYIGEYSNLQRGNPSKKPHGKASYELILRYKGSPRIVTIDFPELFSRYRISVNGEELSNGIGGARVLFSLTQGDTLLTVETYSNSGYYSGMYFPPALGDEATIVHVERIKTIFYSICMFCTAVLLSFTIQLWRSKEGDLPTFWLALLCICFAFYVSYYFVQLFALTLAPFWYFIEDLSLYCLVFSMLRLSFIIAGLHANIKINRISISGAIILPATMLILHAMIPYWTYAVLLHGQIKDLYFFLTFLSLLGASILCICHRRSEYPYIVAGNLVFGFGLLLNIF